jgi:hypothetical protein
MPTPMSNLYYSPKFKYIYVATPKVACSSIKYMLQTAELDRIEHNHLEKYRINEFGYSDFLMNIHDSTKWNLLQPNDTTDIKQFYATSRSAFCFVRNPYTRVLSAFLDKIAANEYRRKVYLGSGYSSPITLRSFLEFVDSQDPAQMDDHWRPQLRHLTSFNIEYTQIGCLERFETDLVTIISSVAPSILEFRRDVREHDTSAAEKISLIDQPCMELIRKIYREDFEGLGYSVNIRDCVKPSFYRASELPLRISVAAAQRRVYNAQIECEQARLERDNLAVERDGLRAERDSLKAQRDGLLESTSWRLTAPIRTFRMLFR